jgi:tetratricopeptide (TPR) repeat protein
MAKRKPEFADEPPLPPGLKALLKQHNFDSMQEALLFMTEVMSILDPQGLKSMMQEGGFDQLGEGADVDSAEYRAQQLIYEAWESNSKVRRIKLAKQALEIWPDCADAYNLLASGTTHLHQALELYRKAVAAALRSFEPGEFDDLKGHFWGVLETRPYMRALHGIGLVSMETNDFAEARKVFSDMLELNPGDNQGVRYLLLDALFRLEDFAAITTLMKQFDDEWAAVWHYGQALHRFVLEGDTPTARQVLQQAVEQNHFVVPYLIGKKKLPKEVPRFISPGQDNEAQEYADVWKSIWDKTPGAVDWLKKHYG